MTGDPTRDRVTEAIARRAAAKGWTWDDLAAAALATMTSAAWPR